MAIKRILLPVHDRDDMGPVAEWAFELARRFGAGRPRGRSSTSARVGCPCDNAVRRGERGWP